MNTDVENREENGTKAGLRKRKPVSRRLKRKASGNKSRHISKMEELDRAIDKIESMVVLASFESTLTGLMLKELFYGNDTMEDKYETFRARASAITAERFKESRLSEVMESREKLNMMEKGLNNFEQWLDSGNQMDERQNITQELNTELKQKFEKLLYKNLAEIKSKLSDTRHDLLECVNLVKWYETRDENIMKILRNRTGGNIQENDDELIGYFLNTQGERPAIRLDSISEDPI